jgi:protein dithiol oxidoreductase (disulfide-forming)
LRALRCRSGGPRLSFDVVAAASRGRPAYGRSPNVKSNVLINLAVVALGACGASEASAQASQFEAGKHYTVLSPAQPTSSDTNRVEVAEVFMFECPGCYAFEPHLQKWLETKADYINFVRIPATWFPVAGPHARAYYTAEALGKTREIDGPFFNEFHVQQNHLDTEAKLADFFAKFGVDKQTFTNTYNSFAINAKVKRGEELVKRYHVQSTPSVVVNGKYLTTGTQAGSYEAWFEIINELASREHAAMSAAAKN